MLTDHPTTVEELLAELTPLLQDEQARRVTTDSRFASPQFVEKLAEMSHGARYEDPARMLHLADLALRAAEACTVGTAGSAPGLADVRARGWSQYANALRVSGRLHEAEEAMVRAEQFCKEGTGDRPLKAALLERMVSLRIYQRRFDDAIALTDKARRIYRGLGESRSVASAMVQKALAQLLSGAPESAARTFNRAIPLLDNEGDPDLLLAACHNRIRAYVEMGKPKKALSLYYEARLLYQHSRDPLIALRTGWQEGQLLRDLGCLEAAEVVLLRTRQGFLESGLLHEMARVSLDLADIYSRLGETEKLRKLVLETLPIFKSLGIDREVWAFLLQFLR